MIWQSWGHSLGGEPAPGELDLNGTPTCASTLPGGRFLDWFNHYVKDDAAVTTGPEFTYFRDWVPTPASPLRPTARRGLPGRRASDLYLSGETRWSPTSRRCSPARVLRERPRRAPTSYSEIVLAAGRQLPTDALPPSDPPGTFAAWTPRAVRAPRRVGRHADADGRARLTRSPRRAGGRPGRAAGGLRQALRRGAGRHQDAAQPADLTGAHRRRHEDGRDRAARRGPPLEAGHRLQLVLAASDTPTATTRRCSRSPCHQPADPAS